MKNSKKMWISIILSISIFVGILLLDLLTKGLIIPSLIPNVGDRVGVIDKFISFIFVKNKGAAWGVFGGKPIFLIIMSVIILALFLTFYVLRLRKVQNKSSCLLGISVGLIAGGCFGNLIDRIIFGYVRDFINFDFMNFPVFNFADIALTFGVIIMVIYFLFFYAKEDKVKEKAGIVIENQKSEENLIENDKIVDENEQKNEELTKNTQESSNEDKNEG